MSTMNLLPIQIHISKDFLHHYINEELNTLSPLEMESDGYAFSIKEDEHLDTYMSFLADGVELDIPLQVKLTKSAGLFSVEAVGGLRLVLEVAYDWDLEWNFISKVTLVRHTWTNKPKASLGQLSMPIALIADIVIKKYKETGAARIEAILSEMLSLRTYWSSIMSKIHETNPFGNEEKYYYLVEINALAIDKIKEMDDIVSLFLWFEASVKISTKPTLSKEYNLPKLLSNNEVLENATSQFVVDVGYDAIANLLQVIMGSLEFGGKKLLVNNISISKNKLTTIQIELISPIEAFVTLELDMVFLSNDQTIHFNYIRTNVKATNLIHRLTSPVLETFINNKIKALFPIKVNDIIATKKPILVKTIGTDLGIDITPHFDELVLRTLEFENETASTTIFIDHFKLELTQYQA